MGVAGQGSKGVKPNSPPKRRGSDPHQRKRRCPAGTYRVTFGAGLPKRTLVIGPDAVYLVYYCDGEAAGPIGPFTPYQGPITNIVLTRAILPVTYTVKFPASVSVIVKVPTATTTTNKRGRRMLAWLRETSPSV